MIDCCSMSLMLSHAGTSSTKPKRSASAGSSGSLPRYDASLPDASSRAGGFMAAHR